MNAIPPLNLATLPAGLLDELGTLLAAVAPWRLPLIRAARAGTIAFLEAERGAPWPKRAIETVRKPAVFVIGDDDYRSTGPSGWRCLNAAVRWPRAVLLHGTGGEPEHYEAAVAAALVVQRVLIVEADSAHLAEWLDLLERRHVPSVFTIFPRPGQRHPRPVPAEAVQ